MQDYLFLFFYASNFEEVEGGGHIASRLFVRQSFHPSIRHVS